MDHFDLTPKLRQEKQVALKKQLLTPMYSFGFVCVLPLFLFMLFYFGVFKTTKKGEFEDLEKATALVTTNNGVGTAFLISYSQLLTARHVVEDLAVGDKVDLVFERHDPQIMTKATIEWIDQTSYPPDLNLDYFLTDLAILKLDNPGLIETIDPLTLGNSDDIPNLTPIIAIGYPNGEYSITRGDINSNEIDGKPLFKIDAATNPGNSGGPLISADDETVIGMMVGQRKGIVQGENIANKVNNIVGLMDQGGVVIQ